MEEQKRTRVAAAAEIGVGVLSRGRLHCRARARVTRIAGRRWGCVFVRGRGGKEGGNESFGRKTPGGLKWQPLGRNAGSVKVYHHAVRFLRQHVISDTPPQNGLHGALRFFFVAFLFCSTAPPLSLSSSPQSVFFFFFFFFSPAFHLANLSSLTPVPSR